MKYDKFHNCLRLQITCDELSEKRIEALVAHCVNYGFDNVMLMINTEEFNLGHITLEEAKPWVDVLKRAKEKLEEKGITVSLNNWMELGHADRGRALKKGQENFETMVDMYGRKSTLAACPMGKNWRKYFTDYVKYIVGELKPDTYWIEDDFRLYGHAPLQGFGCWCDEHMAYYNRVLGTNYTREEMVAKVFAPGDISPERKLWLDTARDTMNSLAKEITDVVKSVSPDTDVALMSSGPEGGCIDARDWDELFSIIGKGGHKINRIHLPYEECIGKEYIYNLNRISMAVRAFTKDDIIVMPEVEYGSSSLYLKSARYLRFMLEASLPLLCSGMTYSIYDFIGNGVRESFGFGKVVKEMRPYMQAVEDLGLKFSSLTGVIVPAEVDGSYKLPGRGDCWALLPREYNLAALLSGFGVNYAYSREKAFKGKTIFLCGNSVSYFSDDELKKLFADNYIIIDGGGVIALKNRGLEALICVKDAEKVAEDTGYHTYEEAADKKLKIDGIEGLRASCRKGTGEFLKITYDGEVKTQTYVCNENMERLAPAVVTGNGFMVWPYILVDKHAKQFMDLRRYFMLKAISEHTEDYIICDIFGVSPYYYKEENKKVIMLLNGNMDDYDEIPLHVGKLSVNGIKLINKKGEEEKVEFERDKERLVVKTPLEGMSSVVLIIE